MLVEIDKDSKTTLLVQVSENLIQDIRLGKLKRGKRLPGERMLAQRFGVSRGTVIEALSLLEQQNYIERIPARGTFVADDVKHELSAKRIIFPFPEAAIGIDSLGSLENWGITSEFYRGMLAEASTQNTEIIFQHFEEPENEIQLARQLRRAKNYDGAVFIGEQLHQLRDNMLSMDKPCVVQMGSSPDIINHTVATVSHDFATAMEEIVVHLSQRSFEQLLMIGQESHIEYDKYKIGVAIEAARERNLLVEYLAIEMSEINEQSCKDSLLKLEKLLSRKRSAIFCLHTDLVPFIYDYARQKGLKIGDDLGVVGYASGVTFNNLIPELTYSQTNNFEAGKTACRMVIDGINGKEWKGLHKQIPGALLIKQST